MERFSHVSLRFSLCSSCVSMISPNIQPLCLRQARVYFSSSTKLMKSTWSQAQESLMFVKGSQIRQPCHQKVGELSTNLKNSSGSQHYSLTPDLALCKMLSNSCLQKMCSFSYQTYSNAKHTMPLLRLGSHVNSAQSYSTSTPTPTPEPPGKMTSRKARLSAGSVVITWKSVLLLASVGVLIVMVVQYLKTKKELEIKKARNRTLGKAKLGGDWTLTDHHGNRRSSTEFRGQWLLIYFGFTHCPDVCPEELEKIVGVINKTDADEKLPKIQPLIITVDPERDTPQALKEYCSEFSPRLLGFTGSPEEIHKATHAYRVYFSAGPKDDDNDYIVDHSIISYLVDPEGQFVEYFGQNKTVDNIYTSIQFHINMYNKQHKSA